MLVVLIPKDLEKASIHLSNNTFPIDRVIVNAGNLIWGFGLFIKILNFNDHRDIYLRHQKRVTFVTILVFFERSCMLRHSCKVS